MIPSINIGQARLAFVESKLGRKVPEDLLTITLIGHRALVAVAEADDRTAGGIWIPNNAKERGGHGYILMLGPNFGEGFVNGTANYDPWFPKEWLKDRNRSQDFPGQHFPEKDKDRV